MPVTRSASRVASAVVPNVLSPPRKRKPAQSTSSKAKKPKVTKELNTPVVPTKTPTTNESTIAPHPAPIPGGTGEVIPAQLTFSFEEARKYLIKVDPRFSELFGRLKCKPFEELEVVDPFRTLTVSILGQQISWLAARSIGHKFIRLFDPSIPELLSETKVDFFPTAEQVAATDIPTLRTAGLSGRKAEYVQDLANHFKDGRLSAAQLTEWDDEELEEKLLAVRGIGKWTVNMFAIFSLRRPDILPVGDLGIQKGLLRWILSSHNGTNVTISPLKLAKQSESANTSITDTSVLPPQPRLPPTPGPDGLSTPVNIVEAAKEILRVQTPTADRDIDSQQLPTPVTPAPHPPISQEIPTADKSKDKAVPFELPDGITLATLKSRLDGKKIKKSMYLSPQEMEILTESWRPYRSLACFYLWALSEE